MNTPLTIIIIYNPDLRQPWRVLIGDFVFKSTNLSTVLECIQKVIAEREQEKP